MSSATSGFEGLRSAIRKAARSLSPRQIAVESGVSYSTIYRLIGEGAVARPNRATLQKLERFIETWQAGGITAVRESEASYLAGPSVAKFGPRAREIILQYLRRLEAAGLGTEELIQMEHLLADRSYAQRFSTSRGGPLTEDDEIILIEATWRAIADTLALRGIRP